MAGVGNGIGVGAMRGGTSSRRYRGDSAITVVPEKNKVSSVSSVSADP